MTVVSYRKYLWNLLKEFLQLLQYATAIILCHLETFYGH